MFPVIKSGDGAAKVFDLGFPFLEEADVRVTVAGVLKTRGTDYALQVPEIDSGNYSVRFFTAPAAASNNIEFSRNTPLYGSAANPEVGPRSALRALYRAQEQGEAVKDVVSYIAQATLIANTGVTITAPFDGTLSAIGFRVSETITTGGTVKAQIESTDVTSASVTIANSAVPGTYKQASSTAANTVKKGQKVQIVTSGFATAGAGEAVVKFTPAA